MKEKFKLRPKMAFFALSFVFASIFFAWSVNFSFTQLKSAMVFSIPSARAQTTSLYITNIHISSLTSTSVTIAWDTNLLSDSKVRIGTTSSYNDFTCGTCYLETPSKTHRISIGGLKANTTYHYQVISKTDKGEEKTSIDRPFVTPGGSEDKDAPFITFVRVGADDTVAEVTIYTSEEAHVAIAYGPISSPNFDAYLPVENRVNDNAGPFNVVHTLNLPPVAAAALVPGTTYYYRLQAFDEAGNSSQSGEFSFVTSSGGDRVFTTGQCDGNIPIGECSPGGLYCDVGTATLVSNCEHCGFRCASGQTCQPGGVCSQDPGLTGDPYQCNRADCYKSCSGDDSLSCTANLECQAAGAGTCIDDGVFNNPALSGCYYTYPRCDANVILKVKKDRECAKWLTCGTAIEQKNTKTGQEEELCLNLTACTSLGESNQCNNYVDLPQEEVTYRTPDEINKLKWLSGSVTAGLDWQYQEGSPIIRGYYPWSAMEEVGEKIKIKNFNFEEISSIQSDKDLNGDGNIDSQDKYKGYDIKAWTNFTKYTAPGFDPKANPTTLQIVEDPAAKDKKSNYVLKVGDMNSLNQGVRVQASGDTSVNSKYAVNLKIKSDNSDPQKAILSLNSGGSNPTVRILGTYALTSGWQYITTSAVYGVGGSYIFLDIYVAEGSAQAFYVDEIKIEPVLQVGAGVFLNRSCRLYPQEDAPSCEYYDSNGIFQRGWKGYCLQRDPKNDSVCLSWWPVDILYGESNLFGAEEAAGYTGRSPLYYCLESGGSAGNIPTMLNDGYDGATNLYHEYLGNDPYPNNTYLYNIAEIRVYTNSNPAGGPYYYTDPPHSPQIWFNNNQAPGWRSARNDTFVWTLDAVSSTGAGRTLPGGRPFLKLRNENNDCKSPWNNGSTECCISCGEVKEGVTIIDWYFDSLTQKLEYWGVTWAIPTGFPAPNIKIEFYYKEMCNKIVQVVDDAGLNAAWAGKINSSGNIVPDLNYTLATDLNPYGGAVTEGTDPTLWPKLPVEEADTANFPEPPNQVRAGKPYACVGDCARRVCWGGALKDGSPCINNVDCLGANPDATVNQGICIGVGTCAQKNPAGPPKACIQDSDCLTNTAPPINFGPCLGGAGSFHDLQTIKIWPYLIEPIGYWCYNPAVGEVALDVANCLAAGYQWINRAKYYCFNKTNGVADFLTTRAVCEGRGANYLWTNEPKKLFAQLRIRGLFTRSYGLYIWDPSQKKYNLDPDSDEGLQATAVYPNHPDKVWGPPGLPCSSAVRPAYNPRDESTYCGYAPVVKNIKIGDGSSNTVTLGRDGGKVRLSFNSRVDTEQQPLKKLSVDWGDGAKDTPTAGYKSKDDPANPHVLTHNYNGNDCDEKSCTYHIHILLEDNWGWCSPNPLRGVMYYSVCSGGNKNPIYLQGSGSNDGGWCDPPGNNNCSGGTCSGTFYCENYNLDYWDPVDTCRPTYNSSGNVVAPECPAGMCVGGSKPGQACAVNADCPAAACSDGVCAGGMDNGRPCGELTVILK